MRVIWILINCFFVYTDGQNFNDCVVTPPHDWRAMYTGQRNTTVTGKTCMLWKDTPHPSHGPLNHCRAPREDPASAIGPWCYIHVEPWWEYCFIPTCDEHCVTSYVDKNYRGTLNVTVSGYSCRMLNLNTPLPADGVLPMFHDEDANYCRSPPGHTETKPWCYVNSTDKRWEHCAVPSCNDIQTTICPDLLGSDLFTEPTILTGHIYDSVVTFKCKAGYRIQGSSSLKCSANPQKSIYGHWNTTQPTCIRTDCPVLRINNSNIQMTDSIHPPAVLRVLCDRGYQLQGNPNIRCDNNGLWGPIPSCVGVPCPATSVAHSNIQSVNNKRFPDTLIVTCDNGYKIVGHNILLCLDIGQWSTAPTCIGVQCHPISIANSNVEIIGIKRYPDSIQVTCNSGYQINGSSNISCTETGKWNSISTCVGISCPDLVPRAHLTNPTRLSNYTYTDTIRFVCDTGYYIVGDNTIVCSRQGLWNGSVPTCEPVPCPILNIANATNQTVNRRYYYRDRVTIACYKGFALKGNANLACLANGEWSSTLPVCQKIACNATRVLPNVLATRSETMVDVNDNVTFFCRPGFSGQTVISTCSFDLTWIPKPPICKSKSVVISIGLSYTVFGLVDAGIITCSAVVILGGFIYFRRRLKAAESHYESIQMHKDFKSPGNTEEVYSELT